MPTLQSQSGPSWFALLFSLRREVYGLEASETIPEGRGSPSTARQGRIAGGTLLVQPDGGRDGLKPGEEFNPSRDSCGFFPQDIVGRQRWLTDGQKRVYERLVRFNGRNGNCFPSQETLSFELGKSDRQIRRDVEELEKAHLIAHRRNGRRSNRYVFLWHEIFDADRTSTSDQYSSDRTTESTPNHSNRTHASTRDGELAPRAHDTRTTRAQDNGVRSQPDISGSSIGHIRQSDRTPTAYDIISNPEESIRGRHHSDDSARFAQKPCEVAPECERHLFLERTNNTTLEDRKTLAAIMARMAGRQDQPTSETLDAVLNELGHHHAGAFCSYLRTLSAKFQAGGHKAPQGYGWFISTARGYRNMQVPAGPPADRCRHSKPWDTCCNRPSENAALTEALG